MAGSQHEVLGRIVILILLLYAYKVLSIMEGCEPLNKVNTVISIVNINVSSKALSNKIP